MLQDAKLTYETLQSFYRATALLKTKQSKTKNQLKTKQTEKKVTPFQQVSPEYKMFSNQYKSGSEKISSMKIIITL